MNSRCVFGALPAALLFFHLDPHSCGTPPARAQATSPRLEILVPGTNVWARLNSSVVSNRVIELEASSNLVTWESIATLHDGLFAYPDADAPNHARRFYRLQSASRDAANDWKNQILFPDEPFISPQVQPQDVRWVKFAILLNEPGRVYYQHSAKFPFHYEFAVARLEPFRGLDRAGFDAVSLRRANQQVVLGAVLYPPDNHFVEYGIQLVGLDPYPAEEVGRWLEWVRATVHAPGGAGVYYLPTFEQTGPAQSNAVFFTAKGFPVASTERWISANHCYAPGWALGRLKYFPAAEIDGAFADGRLRPEDILLTDGVPAETPLVAGIISLTPATPNSHVAILSRSFGIPFVHLTDERDRLEVRQMDGREVILRAITDLFTCEIRVIDVEGALEPALKAELLALKRPPPIQFAPKQSFGALSASTDTLAPAEIRFFGGKAANYGLLRRSVPANCPPAIAFSFDLWDAFLDQTLAGGNTVRAEIATRLAPYTNYPPDVASLKTTLATIRDLIRQTARFTAAQQQAITNALAVFNPQRRIRFRSSTNVEDSEHFTGAGLYDSFSGCLLDDLDGDTTGPSHCDPDETNERGVFRAIQRVYASFYNDNAFLERLRHGVDETRVAMGVLVHHSFPDEEELANGVATLRFNIAPSGLSAFGDLVTQFGATPVTNADGTAAPEVVGVSLFGSFSDLTLKRRSSLVPLGDYVVDWTADYQGFLRLFANVGRAFQEVFPGRNDFFLDFEYKKDVTLGLVVKQVREIPSSGTTHEIVPYLIDEPATYCVAQQELSDVFANHRLKSLWSLRTASFRLAATNLVRGLFTKGTVEYLEGGTRRVLDGPLAEWPGASNSFNEPTAAHHWTTGSGADQRRWRLETTVPGTVTGGRPPVVIQQDLDKAVTVAYAAPVPVLDFSGQPSTTTTETVFLAPGRPLGPGARLQERAFIRTNVCAIQTAFYWPKPPEGIVAGYTAPLVHFVETRITGLTAAPLVLTNYYSQTYRPGHHNFSEEFIFEPGLEPGLDPAVLEQLEAANIQFIYAQWRGDDDVTLQVLGRDGKFRRL